MDSALLEQADAPRILLADDHALFRDALLTYIQRAEPSVQVESVNDLDAARRVLEEGTSFQLAMIDWHMPGVTSLESITDLATQFPQTRFTLMSGVIDQDRAQEALDAGLWGYFPKTLSGRALIDGIRQVLSGQRFIPYGPTGQQLAPAYHGEKLFFKPNGAALAERGSQIRMNLTARENEVLRHLCDGLTNAEIAERMNVKEVTVKLHLRNAFDKIEARNRTDAVVKCRQLGVISDE